MSGPGVYMVTRVIESVFEVVAGSPEDAALICHRERRLVSKTVRIQSVTSPDSEIEERATRFCEWDGREIPASRDSIYCSSRCDTDQFTYVPEDD